MKEATGELNMTVVTIVAIAALLGFFYVVIWPNLQVGMALGAACNAANGKAYETTTSNGAKISCNGTQCTYTADSKTSKRTCG